MVYKHMFEPFHRITPFLTLACCHLFGLSPNTDPTPDPRPEWIRVLVGNVHYLHFGILLFLLVLLVTVIVSYLTEPIPEKCVSRNGDKK